MQVWKVDPRPHPDKVDPRPHPGKVDPRPHPGKVALECSWIVHTFENNEHLVTRCIFLPFICFWFLSISLTLLRRLSLMLPTRIHPMPVFPGWLARNRLTVACMHQFFYILGMTARVGNLVYVWVGSGCDRAGEDISGPINGYRRKRVNNDLDFCWDGFFEKTKNKIDKNDQNPKC